MAPMTRSAALDGNHAVADVAHRTNEVIAIYPITPSTPMGELCDEWSSRGRTNVWGLAPRVVQMQSEGGVAGAVHGSLQAGALTTTFTASQGLLLMLPNLYKIAGELTPFCMHVAARTVASHALSIFGDHSDVMAVRQSGVALLASATVQEAHDLAAIGQAATLRSRIPVVHFFDGFRTSHEINHVDLLDDDTLRALVPIEQIESFRSRSLTPDRPVVRGTAQNPDTFFQAREAANPYYDAAPGVFLEVMRRFERLTGRAYRSFDYVGHDAPSRVVVAMGSGTSTLERVVRARARAGDRVGLVKVRLYRPFDTAAFLASVPETTEVVAVLDRTKEPGAPGEPLFLDVVAALALRDRPAPRVIGGRYGLSSKEFTPAMAAAVLDEACAAGPRRDFTVGILDDLTGRSLKVSDDSVEDAEPDVVRAVFYGLGSDGTVGAAKSTIKIISERTDLFGQGYFVYDSKKAGAMTVSHLRFGPRRIEAPYLVRRASFVACHQAAFLARFDVLATAARGATFLLNTGEPPERVWETLPRGVQETILVRELRLWVIDALAVAREAGLGRRINTVMQTCFFSLSGVLPHEQAIAEIKASIESSYARKGSEMVRRNFAAVDAALAGLCEVDLAGCEVTAPTPAARIPDHAPEFVQQVTAVLLANRGDSLPVSAFPPDGTWPTGTARWERRGIADEIPIWDRDLCIHCNRCAFVCPHAAIRAKVFPNESLSGAPDGFRSTPFRSKELPDLLYSLQVAPDDCTGCSLCVVVCPAKDKADPRRKAINMTPARAEVARERTSYDWFLGIPEIDRTTVKLDPKHSQLLQPLFEYSGACAGCGETPYIKLLTQLFGDRALIANATGCSSIYGGNLPTTPYCTDAAGRGPAWSNSLFEDNAEFGLGFRLSVSQQRALARALVGRMSGRLPERLVRDLLANDDADEEGLGVQRERVAALRARLEEHDDEEARLLAAVADALVPKSVWIVGGDGWAYDIGYGGLDHVLASGEDVNILVLDTEVYSNTGGQASKATPLGAAAKFAAAGKEVGKKDLGMMAMAYGNVYVAQIAFGASDRQTVKALREAESFPGPSLLIAYSHCIAHGYDLALGIDQQKRAVDSGAWPLYRFDPRRIPATGTPLVLDSREPRIPLAEYVANEARFRVVERQDPARFRRLMERAQRQVRDRFGVYEQLARVTVAHVAAATPDQEA